MVSRGLSSTRAQAKSLIEMDRVQVNGIFVKKAGLMVGDEDELVVNSPDYVGRGAFKLEAAIREFQLNVSGLRVIDVGASTGGFTEILLRSGALEVLAIDVGTDQMVSKLKEDPRVISREGTHILDVVVDEPYDGAVIDLSFISISKVIAHIKTLLKDTGFVVALIKPQFEVGKTDLPKDGVIKDKGVRDHAVQKAIHACREAGFLESRTIESPIKGKSGNSEYLVHLVLQ